MQPTHQRINQQINQKIKIKSFFSQLIKQHQQKNSDNQHPSLEQSHEGSIDQ